MFSEWTLSFSFPGQNTVCVTLVPRTCHVPGPPHSSLF
jgi:hypothetical protein